jgi:hypothetical protein
MDVQNLLSVARDFSETPGPRYKHEGDFSGELFMETLLQPRYERARAARAKLVVDLDGTEGYATSFLEQAFGGLARVFAQSEVLTTLEFISNDEPYLVDEIRRYIRDARR